jgi:RND family efflux transporter MFP subunit
MRFLLPAFVALLMVGEVWAQGAVPVVVEPLKAGRLAPQRQLVGTMRYGRVSALAAEVQGMVKEVSFQEGGRLRRGQVLLRLDTQDLEQELQALEATLRASEAELRRLEGDFRRIEALYSAGSVARQRYEQGLWALKAQQASAEALKARLRRLKIRLGKSTIRSPFDALVLRKHTEVGQWVAPGTVVATLAEDEQIEILVNVPQEMLPFIRPGQEVEFEALGRNGRAQVLAVVPRADVPSRSFPVRLRAPNPGGFFKQGMEAWVWLPAGRPVQAFLVNRDALLNLQGQWVLFVAQEGRARMVPVKLLGYEGRRAAVQAAALREGMLVVLKGQERLRDGQPIELPR